LVIEVPVRFPPLIPAEDNPTTVAGVLLGRYLFHDPVLSGDSTLACAGCHQPELGFADDRALSEGIDGTEGRRNASALSNLGFLTRFFWDGRAQSLEDQALEPVADPIEMHLSWDEAEARLASHRFYPTLFERAFGTRVVTRERTVKAIAQFERTLVSANSKFDRERRGEATYTPEEALGEQIFQNERGDCFHCHFVTPVFTDNLFHNVGIDSVLIDRGLGELTGEVRDMGLFKTPSLRNVEFTAPYMHDGRFETLTEVVEHYNSGGFLTPTVDPLIRVGQGLGLTDEEVQGLVAFLKALSDPDFLTNPAHRSPFPASSR
jgi:cytochrome c peroxidase